MTLIITVNKKNLQVECLERKLKLCLLISKVVISKVVISKVVISKVVISKVVISKVVISKVVICKVGISKVVVSKDVISEVFISIAIVWKTCVMGYCGLDANSDIELPQISRLSIVTNCEKKLKLDRRK